MTQPHQILKYFHISCNKLSLCELDEYDGRKNINGKQLTDIAFPRTLFTTYSQSSIWHEQLEKYRTQGVDRHHGHLRDADGITEQQSKEKKVSRFGCYLMAGSHIPGECGRPCNENTLYPANDLAALQGIKDLQCDENSLYPRNRLRRLFTGIVQQLFRSDRSHLFYFRAKSVHIRADLVACYVILVHNERENTDSWSYDRNIYIFGKSGQNLYYSFLMHTILKFAALSLQINSYRMLR